MLNTKKYKKDISHSGFAIIWGLATTFKHIQQSTNITPKTKNLQLYRDSVGYAMFDKITAQYIVLKAFFRMRGNFIQIQVMPGKSRRNLSKRRNDLVWL